ncbi:MAG: dTDP-4-dehydrorhamnose reductase [Candidatus Dormibacteria bacterium]
MRVLIFGAGGQLGIELVNAARAGGHEVVGLRRADHDITDYQATRTQIIDEAPDIVFNPAAYNGVDRAETDAAAAWQVNAVAPGVIAAACLDAGSTLVHYSTDFVFDGTAHSPIPETQPVAPLGEYGRGKHAGEQAVRDAGLAAAYLVRTAWVFGEGANFIRTVLRVTRERGEMRVVHDQRGSPTWARDLAGASLRLIEVGEPGIYHLTNSGDCSKYELAVRVVELAGVDATVTPISTHEYPTPARRPAYSVLDNRRWRDLGEPPLRVWDEAVAEYVRELRAAP